MSKTAAACAMRDLPEYERDLLIDAADNVHDLRPVLNRARRNRQLAKAYRDAFKWRGPYA